MSDPESRDRCGRRSSGAGATLPRPSRPAAFEEFVTSRRHWNERGNRLLTAFTLSVLAVSMLAPGPRELRLAAAPRSGGTRTAEGQASPLRSRSARPGELPDTVLARVGARRTITLSDFRERWHEAQGTSVDSLTLPEARKFLELLVDRELLAEAASRETWVWTPQESTGLATLADRLAMAMALDSAMSATRAALRAADPAHAEPDPDLVGTAARDSMAARTPLRFDDALLDRLTAAWKAIPRPSPDSSLASQLRVLSSLPAVAADDTARVLCRSAVGDYLVSDLLGAWRRLSPVYRPRIEDRAQLVDLVKNGLFERLLRAEAARRGLARSPGVARRVALQREALAVSHYTRREVLDRIVPDAPALERYFAGHSADWALPERVRAIRLVLDSRAEADRTALMLRDAAAAESLAARAARAGLGYRVEVSAKSDSALFAAAGRAGTGSVVGPVQDSQGWWVARIEAFLPARPRDLAEVRGSVESRWSAEQGERRLRDLCGRLAREIRTTINERALARLAEPPR